MKITYVSLDWFQDQNLNYGTLYIHRDSKVESFNLDPDKPNRTRRAWRLLSAFMRKAHGV